jgi:tetratricopeptide (TPR) repeat protein
MRGTLCVIEPTRIHEGDYMPKITTVDQLDRLINMGGGMTDHSVLSPEMRRLLDLYASGTAAMQQGNLGEAVRIYRYIVSTWPNFVAARVNLANCLTFVGKPQEALQELKHAHSVAPRDPDIHLAVGRAYESMGDKQKELQQYQEALQDYPHSVDAMNSLGATYREVGQLQMAEQWLLRALDEIEGQDRLGAPMGWKHPGRLPALYNLALTYQDAGDWKKAVECWQKCVSLDSTNSQLRQSLRQAEINASLLPLERSKISTGITFQEARQVRLLFDQYGKEIAAKLGNQIKSTADQWLIEKQQFYKGEAYLDQIEKNAVYLEEGTLAVNLAIAQYLFQGEPVLGSDEISDFVLYTRVTQSQQTTPFHLNFIRSGCIGCPVHDQHSRYVGWRNMRLSGDWSQYMDELEFSCKYYQATYLMSQQYLTAFLQNHELAGSARYISPQELIEVVNQCVDI